MNRTSPLAREQWPAGTRRRPVTRDWEACFVTSADHTGEIGAPAPYVRREFTVGDGLVRATLHVTALGLVEVHLNGAVVGDEVLAPGWTSYRHRLAVSSHDVTDLVHTGAKAIGAIVGEGWAVGRLGWGGRLQIWADRPAAFLQLELDYGDRVEVVATDATWRAGTGAVLANGIYDGETYDARLEPEGWSRPGFDDSGWGDVEVVDWDLATLVATSAPPIRRIEELPAREVLTTPAGRTVVDFGQVATGWVRLTVEGAAGTVVALHHCETLIAGVPKDAVLDVLLVLAADAGGVSVPEIASMERANFMPALVQRAAVLVTLVHFYGGQLAPVTLQHLRVTSTTTGV